MHADYDIREATIVDIPVLVRARRLMFEELDDFDPGTLDRIDEAFVAYLNTEMPAGRANGWVAVDLVTGEWVGAVVSEWIVPPATPNVPRPLRSQLYGLYVRPEFRRRGIARAIVNVAIEAARAAGAGAIQLHASDAGRPLYESLGFRATTEMRLVFGGESSLNC